MPEDPGAPLPAARQPSGRCKQKVEVGRLAGWQQARPILPFNKSENQKKSARPTRGIVWLVRGWFYPGGAPFKCTVVTPAPILGPVAGLARAGDGIGVYVPTEPRRIVSPSHGSSIFMASPSSGLSSSKLGSGWIRQTNTRGALFRFGAALAHTCWVHIYCMALTIIFQARAW